MISVRLRLLILALMPLMVLIPLLLFLGMTRWTRDYDAVLIANVESDLRIADQYLARIRDSTGKDLTSLTGAVEFARAFAQGAAIRDNYLAQKRAELGLDFLYYRPRQASRWPVITAALAGTPAAEIDIFSAEELTALPGDLAHRARIDLIETRAAVPTNRDAETRGMIVHAASPVALPGHDGALVGGILLNRNLQFIDTINELVYLNAVTGGDRQGTATLFLEDVRVSTNVRLFEDVRALGTRVSAEVRGAVLDEGRTWLDRAFVVNDWYISAYQPITDSFGARIGMLYVGFLEAPFTATKRAAIGWMLVVFGAVLALFVPIFLRLAKGIFAPLERMTRTMSRVEAGNLSARNAHSGPRDEIGQVASHLDTLLDQVQDRDRKLRSWNEELNQRVEQRTGELREANEKLEATFKQLVMSEKLASIGEITAGVAHEINNPAAVIQGNLDVIREILGEAAEPVKTELGLIDRQVSRIAVIVSKLLQFARPGEYADYEETVDLAPVISDCLVLVDHVLSRSEVQVITKFNDAPSVRIDAGEMQQVVINLIVNAVQAMNDTGRLTLSLRDVEQDGASGAEFIVSDTGPGIPEDKLTSVFDPFFTTKLSEGTGLGLSISQTLIQRAGGLITARNRPEGGAEFRVWLPGAGPRG